VIHSLTPPSSLIEEIHRTNPAQKTVHHGKIRWRVNGPHGTGGKRQRKFFRTKEATERSTRQKTADSRQDARPTTSVIGLLRNSG
jgi:hypothetical protein